VFTQSDSSAVLRKQANKQKAMKVINKTLHVLSLLNYSDRTYDRTFSGAEAYKIFEGKEIERIDVEILPPFGVTIDKPYNDRFTKFQRFANSIQFTTKERIVRNDLLFTEGEKVKPQKFTDTERNMWQDAIYKDLKFVLCEAENDTTKVVVKVIVQQRWSWSISTSAQFDKAMLGIEFKNIGGLPQRITQQVSANYRKDNPYLVFGEYEYLNIRKSRINVYGKYLYQPIERGGDIRLSRNFFSSESHWAARVSTGLYQNSSIIPNSLADAIKGKTYYNYQDAWGAVAFKVKNPNSSTEIHKIILAARYYRKHYDDRPFSISKDKTVRFLNREYYLGSVGYATWNYFQDDNVFLNGGSEYFPLGLNFNWVFGAEKDEKYGRRFYNNFRMSYSAAFPKLFYLNTDFSLGGYYNGKDFQQKLFQYRLRLYSAKVNLGKKIFFRQFITFKANVGFDRPKDRELILNDATGLRGMYTSQLTAQKIYTITLESVLYGNFKVFGFNGSVALFADLGWLQNNKPYQMQAVQGIGASLRLRNLNFGIGYFDFSLVFYPNFLNTPQKPYTFLYVPEFLKGIRQDNLFEYYSLEPEYNGQPTLR